MGRFCTWSGNRSVVLAIQNEISALEEYLLVGVCMPLCLLLWIRRSEIDWTTFKSQSTTILALATNLFQIDTEKRMAPIPSGYMLKFPIRPYNI